MDILTDEQMKKALRDFRPILVEPSAASAQAPVETAGPVSSLALGTGSASGGPEIWNVVAWGDVRECRSVSSVMEEVREAVELGCRTISIERQGAPNAGHQPRSPERTPTL